MKVQAILTVARDIEPSFPDKFEYKIIDIIDDEEEDIKKSFIECIEFIEEKTVKEGKTILVHCAAGVSRSASVVIAYTMWKNQVSLKEAFATVRSKRPCVWPNEGF